MQSDGVLHPKRDQKEEKMIDEKTFFYGILIFLSLIIIVANSQGMMRPNLAYSNVLPGRTARHIGSVEASTQAENVEVVGHLASVASYVDVQGQIAYLVGDGTLRLVDISEQTAPVEVGSYTDSVLERATDITVEGSYVYITWGSCERSISYTLSCDGGLRIIDVSESSAPIGAGAIDATSTLFSPSNVEVATDHAYVRWGRAGCLPLDGCSGALQVLDISDRTQPTELTFVGASSANGLAIQGHYAYIGGYVCGTALCGTYFEIIDISDPTALSLVQSFNLGYLPGGTRDIEVVGDYAYVTFGGGLRIYDISDPPAAFEISHSLSIAAYDMAVTDDYLYGYTYSESGFEVDLQVVDISTPTTPVEVGFYERSRDAGLAAANGYIFEAAGDSGFYILRYTGLVITGQVADVRGTPINGVTIVSSDGQETVPDSSGTYTLTYPLAGTYSLTPTLSSYTLWPLTRTLTLPPNASGQDFTILPQPVSLELMPGMTATLSYTDSQGLPTQLIFPDNAVTETTTIMLTPTLASADAGLTFAGHAFDSMVYQNGNAQANFTFGAPVTATIHYSELDMRLVSDENELALRWWNANGWLDATTTCTPASTYIRDIANNTLSIPICHLGRYALFGPTNQLFLPYVAR